MLLNLREYHRPTSLDAALSLLNRKDIRTAPLAGGADLLTKSNSEIEAVVDLQDLALDTISFSGGVMSLGAMVRIQTLVEELGDEVDGLLAQAAKLMGGWNLRNQMTVGGVLASGDIHSPISIILAALNAEVLVVGEMKELIPWSEIASRGGVFLAANQLILGVSFEYLERHGAYHQVARTPVDRPIVGAACVITKDTGVEKVNLAIGGFTRGLFFTSVKFDVKAPERLSENVKSAARGGSLFSDHLGGEAYRADLAEVLTKRTYQDTVAQLA